MKTRLHKRATTTPAIRAQLQASEESGGALARTFNLHIATVKKWRARDHKKPPKSTIKQKIPPLIGGAKKPIHSPLPLLCFVCHKTKERERELMFQ